jgi:hypothetical protein
MKRGLIFAGILGAALSGYPDMSIAERPAAEQSTTEQGLEEIASSAKDLSGLELPELHFVSYILENKGKTYETLYADILAHGQPERKYKSKMTTAHEATHDAKEELTYLVQQLAREDGKSDFELYEGFYLFADKFAVLKEPGLFKSDTHSYLPAKFQTETAHWYLKRGDIGPPAKIYIPEIGRHITQFNSLFTFDEWVAAINEVYTGVDLMDKGLWDGGQETLDTLTEFTMHALAYGTYVRQAKAKYWREHPEFREFLAYNLVRAKGIYDKVQGGDKVQGDDKYMRYFKSGLGRDDFWDFLAKDGGKKTDDMRATARAVLGERTKELFGF